MKLITAHRILITAAIAFFLFYALLQTRQYVRLGAASALVQALGAAAVVVGFVVYLRSLRGWGGGD